MPTFVVGMLETQEDYDLPTTSVGMAPISSDLKVDEVLAIETSAQRHGLGPRMQERSKAAVGMKLRRAAGPGKVAATEEANERTTPAEARAALARHEHS